MMTIPQSSLALLLVVAATSNGFAKAANLRQRNLGGTTITTNVETYTAYEDYASAMLAAVNTQRATKGLSPLCLNKKLHIAAQVHSDDMAVHDFMAHEGSNGSKMPQRITQADYDWTSVAENVAVGYVTVDEVMKGWINSPEHLENIMGDYTMFASAYSFNVHGTNQHYWSQEFGTSDTEACDDGYASQDPTQQVQNESVLTPSPTPVTDALATDAAVKAPVTDAYDSVMPSLTPPTPATDSLKGKDCQYEVQNEAETVPITATDALATDALAVEAPVTGDYDSVMPSSTASTPATDSPKGKECESNF